MNIFFSKLFTIHCKHRGIKREILQYIREILPGFCEIKDALKGIRKPQSGCIEDIKIEQIAMDTGSVTIRIYVDEKCYYGFFILLKIKMGAFYFF